MTGSGKTAVSFFNPENTMSADKDRGIRRIKQKRAKDAKRAAKQAKPQKPAPAKA